MSEVTEEGFTEELKEANTIKIKETEILNSRFDSLPYQIVLLFSAFLCGFGYNLDTVLRSVYTSYATNSYSEHSLLSTINVINSVVSVAAQIVFARLSDYFGRLHLFIISTLLYVVGTIIQCQAHNIRVYAVGAIFYNAGYVGVFLIQLLILSDFSTLKWRLLYQFVPTWPFIVIVWVSGNIVASANPLVKWSWDIGMWAFIFPLSSLPFIAVLTYMKWKASKTEEWKDLKGTRMTKRNHSSYLRDIFWQLDLVGLVICTALLGCIFVPLTLAGGSSSKWRDSRIIGTLVTGGVLIPIFLYWESKYARNPIIPFKDLKHRGIWAPLCAAFFNDFVYYVASDYLYPVLLVAVNESPSSSSRIVWLPTFCAVAFSPFFAVLAAKSARLKPYIIFGCLLWVLSMGLFYRYRGGKESHAGIIGGSVVMGIGSTFFTYPLIVALQSMTTHSRMAVITAVYYTVAKVGSAVGASVSGAIWTQTVYREISKRIEDPEMAMLAYSQPYDFIAQYTWGTPERTALVEAYKYVQRVIMTVGLCFTAALLFFVLFMKDRKLENKVAHEDVTDESVSSSSNDDPIGSWAKRKWAALTSKSQTNPSDME